MKIKSIKIKNFRGFREERGVEFGDLTLIVGKNDIGKSTVLEAADIFFGNRKIDADDLNINCNVETDKIEISIVFDSFPLEINIDSGAMTSLEEEFLLNAQGYLEIKKVYTPGSAAQPKVFLKSNIPCGVDHLIALKNAELKALARELEIDGSLYTASINNSIRKAIWTKRKNEVMEELDVDITKEDGKRIYEKLELELPIFTLFSVDRKNSDQDDEIQAPIKASIKELLRDLNDELEPIRKKVLEKLNEISAGTIKKLAEMNPEVAETLNSVADKPAWEKAFSINIESDGVPLNKRGSGVKRLVLINFFRQEAERKRNESSKTDVFYAIEEPETSQHPDWQIKLFEAFQELTNQEGVQIAVTSHHPELCGLVSLADIRFFQKIEGEIVIRHGDESNYKEISNTLGVLPKIDGVRVIVGLEGPNDVEFLKNVSQIFELDGADERILWIPMGGGTLRDFVDKGYLNVLNFPQVYFFDQDSDQKYQDSVNELKRAGHWAELSTLVTMEGYIHPRLYKEIWPELIGNFTDTTATSWQDDWKTKNIPIDLCEFIKAEFQSGNKGLKNYGSEKIKKNCAKISKRMTKKDFEDMGTYQELKAFFDSIKNHL